MWKKACLIILIAALVSCTGENTTRENTGQSSTPKAETTNTLTSPPWTTEYNESTQELELKKSPSDLSGVSETAIINSLNKKYPQIALTLVDHRADTIVLSIADAAYLTREMGSAGAETYLAEATFSLTELPAIKAVRFEFEEGDHASPGLYTRESFEDFK